MEPNKIARKRAREKRIVRQMIRLYCHAHHHSDSLCPECSLLADYAQSRSDACPFEATKSFCSSCKVHCYKPLMRERIRAVMRYSGPRMIYHYPILTIYHLIDRLRGRFR